MKREGARNFDHLFPNLHLSCDSIKGPVRRQTEGDANSICGHQQLSLIIWVIGSIQFEARLQFGQHSSSRRAASTRWKKEEFPASMRLN